jgi:hypothetical protein
MIVTFLAFVIVGFLSLMNLDLMDTGTGRCSVKEIILVKRINKYSQYRTVAIRTTSTSWKGGTLFDVL